MLWKYLSKRAKLAGDAGTWDLHFEKGGQANKGGLKILRGSWHPQGNHDMEVGSIFLKTVEQFQCFEK